jgi:DNA-binding CsgD family transcriptional regulator
MLTLSRPSNLPEDITPASDGLLASAMLDVIACGLIACSAQGELLEANRAAQRELGSGRALVLSQGHLRCTEPQAQHELVGALLDAAQRARRRLLWADHGQDRLTLVVMPAAAPPGHSPAVLILLGRRRLCSSLGLEMLALQHGLTHAEQRVLEALIEIRPARKIAEGLGVAVSTVRTQIQSIRGKVGARNIEELLLRVGQLPPVTSIVG